VENRFAMVDFLPTCSVSILWISREMHGRCE
jgi:hypothetical protein